MLTLTAKGCKVTAYGADSFGLEHDHLQALPGKHDEESIQTGFSQAAQHFGPVHVLVANTGTTDHEYPIWDMSVQDWEKTRERKTRAFLAIKQFLRAAREVQQTQQGKELSHLAIMLVGSGNGPTEFVHDLKDKIVLLNSKAKINAVVPDVPGQQGRIETASCMAFLASPRAGHITGQCLPTTAATALHGRSTQQIAAPLTKRNKVRVAISIDLDAVSGWLGTGYHQDNVLADYSAGFFAARVGVPRLLRMLDKLNLASRCTWFIPGHSAESFPDEVKQVVDSGCEIGLHGYAHESAYQLTPQQERDILVRCIEIATTLTGGKKPIGYRAPLYQLRESTLDLLEEFGFEYDASLTDHDCHPFYAPRRPPLKPIDYSQPASSWMHPVPKQDPPGDRRDLVCLPCNWYMEDMTPLQFLPHVPNSQGYTDVRVIENLWRDRFLWIRENETEPVFPVLMHPDTSGMAHVIGMLERFLSWLRGFEAEGEVEFCTSGDIARWWRQQN